MVKLEKPWLRCPISSWEAFFCERSHERLIAAMTDKHNHDEWATVYQACCDQEHYDDVKTLLRLIYAQTRRLNDKNERYIFARVHETIEARVPRAHVVGNINQWVKNQSPKWAESDITLTFTPKLKDGLVHVVECDSISIVADVREIKNLDNAHVTLVCASNGHPGSNVISGNFQQEEDL